MFQMLPYEERAPDHQYENLLRFVLEHGKRKGKTNQGIGCTYFLRPPQMRFDLRNGIPLITVRKISFWRKAIGEIFAMINGAHTVEDFRRFGCNWWDQWGTAETCSKVGLPEGEFGPGSYGVAFHNFPTPGLSDGFNQFSALVQGLREKPHLRTHEITPWVPYHASEFGDRKVFIAPCHGWIHCDVDDDGVLDMSMDQRSADLPIGVPSNMIQYAALLLALAQATDLTPGVFIHSFRDAHLYDDQLDHIKMMLNREPRRFPTLRIIDTSIKDIFAFRPEHFELSDYDPHPAISGIPVAF